MEPIFMHRMASAAAMPLMAAGGYGGYYYYDQNQYQNQYETASYQTQSGMTCTVLTSDMAIGTNNSRTDVRKLNQFLIDAGYLRGRSSSDFGQATHRAVQNFQRNQGLQPSGVVDAQTRAAIQDASCNGGGGTTSQLSVTGVDAPAQLEAGEQGHFSVRVTGYNYQTGSQLHYRVIWGDENARVRASASFDNATVNSTGSFTHTYTQPGTYTPRFTVTDDFGNHVEATVTVTVVVFNQYGGYTGGGTNCYSPYDRNCYQGSTSYPSSYSNTGPGVGYTRTGMNATQTGSYTTGPGVGYTRTGMNATQNRYSDMGPGVGYTRTGMNSSTSYSNPFGGPLGVDYSCAYDRACLANQGNTGSVPYNPYTRTGSTGYTRY